ncbi:hypothetical protein QBC39DRAFT_312554 [Podospora conica]|nr:hypothetical protein QBC39DRAFT_312554 [Schizothecium conicum]
MAAPGEPMFIDDRAVVVAQMYYGVTIPLVVLATATLAYRLGRFKTRVQSRMNMWSDACITVGYILTLACFGLYVPQSFLTVGFKSPEAILEGQKGSFLSIPPWCMGMAFIKLSVGLTLLRIQSGTFYKAFIYINVALAASYGIGNALFVLLSCRPLSAAWGDFGNGDSTCLPPSAIRIASVTGAVVSVTTDVGLSLAPISFLWNLKRPLRERLVLGFLMGLGLLAGISSIIKNVMIADYGKPGVHTWAMSVSISTWTELEMLLGVIAACIPFCKPVIESCFSKMGISISNTKPAITNPSPGYAGLAYQRADNRDTFRSKQAASSTNTKNQYESEEDLVKDAVELQVPGAGIRKHTDIHVTSAVEDGGHVRVPQDKYYV